MSDSFKSSELKIKFKNISNELINRRSALDKIAKIGLLTSTAFVSNSPIAKAFQLSQTSDNDSNSLSVHVFSKSLQFLNYQDMAQAAAEIGFNGVDLAVRPKGHVLPENIKQDLPLAVEQLLKVGFSPNLMTTAITSVDQPQTRQVLQTAAELGIKIYRCGYYKYSNDKSIPNEIDKIKKQIQGLSLLNKELNIRGSYQNHAGKHVGASLWEVWQMLEGVNNNVIGCQYDIRHASVEGALSWQTGLRLIAPHINSLVLKDYRWRQENGQWRLQNVPIGEGMVDFDTYFKLLKMYQINVPISVHFEYDLGGAEHGNSTISIPQKTVFQAMKKDLVKIKELWDKA